MKLRKQADYTKPKANDSNKPAFGFEKENYVLMIIGIAVIFGGYVITASEGAVHGFGFLGLTLGPIIIFLGFMLEIFAILYKKK